MTDLKLEVGDIVKYNDYALKLLYNRCKPERRGTVISISYGKYRIQWFDSPDGYNGPYDDTLIEKANDRKELPTDKFMCLKCFKEFNRNESIKGNFNVYLIECPYCYSGSTMLIENI